VPRGTKNDLSDTEEVPGSGGKDDTIEDVPRDDEVVPGSGVTRGDMTGV
jgi:hypothetical protein